MAHDGSGGCQNDNRHCAVFAHARCATSVNSGQILEVAQGRGLRYFEKTGHF